MVQHKKEQGGVGMMKKAEQRFWAGVYGLLFFIIGVFAGYGWSMFHYWDILQVVAFS
jgi:hypothetical protein